MEKVNSKSQAIQIIIKMATLPPQIDFISNSEKLLLRHAELFIERLPKDEKRYSEILIENEINDYYECSIIGSDGKCYSVASLDAMF